MFCKYCGASIDDDALFCQKCGKKLASSSAEKTEERAQEVTVPKEEIKPQEIAQEKTEFEQLLEEESENHSAEIQYKIGECYYLGRDGAIKDLAKAAEWFEKAAYQGHANAKSKIGAMYQDGTGIEKDIAKAKQWYKMAADDGVLFAKIALEKLEQEENSSSEINAKENDSVDRGEQVEEAVLTQTIASNGEESEKVSNSKTETSTHEQAKKTTAKRKAIAVPKKLVFKIAVASVVVIGIAVSLFVFFKDPYRRIFYLGSVAEQEEAALNLASYLPKRHNSQYSKEWNELGRQSSEKWLLYFDTSEDKIVALLKKVADRGNAEALYELGNFYTGNNGRSGIAKDENLGIQYYEQAANNGHAGAMFELGKLYNFGSNDFSKAKTWYKKAGNAGYYDAYSYLASILYAEGDKDSALDYYLKAARNGNPELYVSAAKIYVEKRDFEKAFSYYQKAFSLGVEDAKYGLGLLYFYGAGVNKNYKQAMLLLSKYVKSKEPKEYEKTGGAVGAINQLIDTLMDIVTPEKFDAMYYIGYMYQYGLGITRNIPAAKQWYQKAADGGHEDAKAALKKLQ